MIMFSLPSFAVLSFNLIGNVKPLSVAKAIPTFEQFNGLAVVLATSHLSSCILPANTVSGKLKLLTTKGPALLTTSMFISSKPNAPAIGLLSLANKRMRIFRG